MDRRQKLQELKIRRDEVAQKRAEKIRVDELIKRQTSRILELSKSKQEEIIKTLESNVLEKVIPMIPEKGDNGYTPIKGQDYFDGETYTDEEVLALITPLIPKPKKGEKGKDGSPDTPEEVRDKIKSLKKDARLSVFDLKDTEYIKGKGGMQWSSAGGLSKVSHDTTLNGDGTADSPLSVIGGGGAFTILTTSSVIDDLNNVFIMTGVPTLLNINGSFYNAGATSGGVVMWTHVGATVTTAYPVGVGGCLFGLK